ncbi:MAG: hypothetical protein EGQ76_03665 [Sutterella sp.]|nr:hypothetical protein [Sutterella sp.]
MFSLFFLQGSMSAGTIRAAFLIISQYCTKRAFVNLSSRADLYKFFSDKSPDGPGFALLHRFFTAV